jgi:hypothetical protein
MNKVTELCGNCFTEVQLDKEMKVQRCPICGHYMLPCCMCEEMKCHSCLLDAECSKMNENMKDKRIVDLFNEINFNALYEVYKVMGLEVYSYKKQCFIKPTIEDLKERIEILANDIIMTETNYASDGNLCVKVDNISSHLHFYFSNEFKNEKI